MKKHFAKLLIPCLLISFCVPSMVQGIEIKNPLGNATLYDLINRIINYIFTIALSVGAILFVLAGYRFIMAAGDPEKIMTAKKMVWWTIIGLIVIIASKGIMALMREIFKV